MTKQIAPQCSAEIQPTMWTAGLANTLGIKDANRCSRKGVIPVAGKHYCKQHAAKLAESAPTNSGQK